ncbi:MAG TPA: hypothetical protein VM686_35745 [Polyangiaceae bacterium]|nr:hypothetical protein [Polyangiaceae bacterium]
MLTFRKRVVIAVLLVVLFGAGTLSALQYGSFAAYRRLQDLEWHMRATPDEKRETAHQALAFVLGDPHDAFGILLEHGDASSIPYLRAALERQPDDGSGGVECTWEHGMLALERLEAPEQWKRRLAEAARRNR